MRQIRAFLLHVPGIVWGLFAHVSAFQRWPQHQVVPGWDVFVKEFASISLILDPAGRVASCGRHLSIGPRRPGGVRPPGKNLSDDV